MKIIIEQKDVGMELDLERVLVSMMDYVSGVSSTRRGPLTAGESLAIIRKNAEEIIRMKNDIGTTLAGARVSIKKNRKNPGPKKGSRNKEVDASFAEINEQNKGEQ